jgi:hypothetical protein
MLSFLRGRARTDNFDSVMRNTLWWAHYLQFPVIGTELWLLSCVADPTDGEVGQLLCAELKVDCIDTLSAIMDLYRHERCRWNVKEHFTDEFRHVFDVMRSHKPTDDLRAPPLTTFDVFKIIVSNHDRSRAFSVLGRIGVGIHQVDALFSRRW